MFKDIIFIVCIGFSYKTKTPQFASRNPDMKMMRRSADFSGTKGKREENEERISM
jgi:basic membrane lipoprotein Med (substrate-binding protein (PBP1-ABC) superfamily)